MKNIVMCCVILICATIVHGTDSTDNVEESEKNSVMHSIERIIEDHNDIINRAKDIIDYEAFSKGSELATIPELKTVDNIMLQTKAAEKGGASKTHCYEAAKRNARIAKERATNASTACGEEYKKIVEANVVERIEVLKTLYIEFSSFKNDIDEILNDTITALITKYIKNLRNILTVTSKDSLINSTELDSCLRKITPNLTADLQNVQSDASACISAS